MYIYIYITTCFFWVVIWSVLSFILSFSLVRLALWKQLKSSANWELFFNEARDELVSKILVVAEQVCNDNDLYVKCLHWPAHHNICPCKISAD